MDGILTGKVHTVPSRSDLRYATAAMVSSKATVDQLEAAMRYALKLPAEEGAFMLKVILGRPGMMQPLLKVPAWAEWHRKHKGLMV